MRRTLCRSFAMFCMLSASTTVAAEPELNGDGWYRWQVPAAPEAQNACCYEFRSDRISSMGCNLRSSGGRWTISRPAVSGSDSMLIYVEVDGGKVRRILPLSSTCPISGEAEVRTLEYVSTAESIAWLRRLIEVQPKMADEAIMAVSHHREDEAVPALISILEDQQQNQDNREQALFWMAHSDSDLAYAYIDQLLDP
jgi:hypothetical protein